MSGRMRERADEHAIVIAVGFVVIRVVCATGLKDGSQKLGHRFALKDHDRRFEDLHRGAEVVTAVVVPALTVHIGEARLMGLLE